MLTGWIFTWSKNIKKYVNMQYDWSYGIVHE